MRRLIGWLAVTSIGLGVGSVVFTALVGLGGHNLPPPDPVYPQSFYPETVVTLALLALTGLSILALLGTTILYAVRGESSRRPA